MEVSAAYAKNNLAELLKAVEKGKTVVISRYRKPVARIVPAQEISNNKPKFGTGKGVVKIIDPQWDKAIETEEELTAFLNGYR